MKNNWKWILGIFGLVFVLGLAPSLKASVCDEDPPNLYPRKIQPVLIVGPLLDIMLNWFTTTVGLIFPEEMDMEVPLAPWDEDHTYRFNKFGHTMFMHLSDVEGELNKDIMRITSEMGKVTVRINFPALTSHVDITNVTHDTEDCGTNMACLIENGILGIANGMDFGMTIDESSSYIEQAAEVCVTQVPACAVQHPLDYTLAELEGITIILIEESDVPAWMWSEDAALVGHILNGINAWVNSLMHALVMDMVKSEIYSILEDPDNIERGLLIDMISFDIQRDGCTPPHEMMECGTACGNVPQSGTTRGRTTGLALYGLPAVVMAGLILWRRRKRGERA